MTAIQLANLREAKARAPQAFDKRRETWPETQSPLWLLNERIISLAQELWEAGVFLWHFLKSELSGMRPRLLNCMLISGKPKG